MKQNEEDLKRPISPKKKQTYFIEVKYSDSKTVDDKERAKWNQRNRSPSENLHLLTLNKKLNFDIKEEDNKEYNNNELKSSKKMKIRSRSINNIKKVQSPYLNTGETQSPSRRVSKTKNSKTKNIKNKSRSSMNVQKKKNIKFISQETFKYAKRVSLSKKDVNDKNDNRINLFSNKPGVERNSVTATDHGILLKAKNKNICICTSEAKNISNYNDNPSIVSKINETSKKNKRHTICCIPFRRKNTVHSINSSIAK